MRCDSWDVHSRVERFKETATEEKLDTVLPCQSHRSRDLVERSTGRTAGYR